MAVSIDSVQGIGAPPAPATIHVEGTASECEAVQVSSSCSTVVRTVNRTGPDPWNWTVDLPNDRNCACGQPVRVAADCAAEQGTGRDRWSSDELPCEQEPKQCWDDITLTTPATLPCVPAGGTAPVTFTAQVTPAAPPYTGPYEWQVIDAVTGAVLQPYTPGGAAFTFQFSGPGTYKVRVRVRQPNCPVEGDLIDADNITLAAQTPCAVALTGPTQTACTDGQPTAPETYTAHTNPSHAGPTTGRSAALAPRPATRSIRAPAVLPSPTRSLGRAPTR